MSQMTMRLIEQNMSTEARLQNTGVRQNTTLVTLIKQLHYSEVKQNSAFNAKVKSLGKQFNVNHWWCTAGS